VTSADQGSTPLEVIELSPQREEAGQIPPTSAAAGAPCTDTDKEAESVRREGEHREANPPVVPSTTTLPESSSSGRTSPSREEICDEPVHVEDAPATNVAGDRVTATNVAGGEAVPPQQTHTGKLLSCKHFSVLVCIALFSLDFLAWF
jgi:hypothetical protein